VTSGDAQVGRCPKAHVEQRRASSRRSEAGVQAGRAVPGPRQSGGPTRVGWGSGRTSGEQHSGTARASGGAGTHLKWRRVRPWEGGEKK